MNRREFLQILLATGGTLTAASCGVKPKDKKLIPYLVPPDEEIIPGKPVFYKSTCTECPAGCGISVKAYDKVIDNKHVMSPVKLEGSTDHPINKGGLCIRGQAALSRLYHPERIKHPLIRVNNNFIVISWEEAYKKISAALGKDKEEKKKSVFLSGRTTGSLSKLIDIFCEKLKVERLPEFEPFSHAALREANATLFGKKEIPLYDIAHSDFLLTIGTDIVGTFVSPVSYGKQYSEALKDPRFVWTHIEPHVSLSGLAADNRMVINPQSEYLLLEYLLKKNNYKNRIPESIINSFPEISSEEVTQKCGVSTEALKSLEEKFAKVVRPLLIYGELATAGKNGLRGALLAGCLQWANGMIGTTIDFSRSENYERVGSYNDIEKLTSSLKEKEIDVLFLRQTNPVGQADSEFKERIEHARLKIGMAELMNETLESCDIVLPLSHSLESWGDTESRENIYSLIEPSTLPLYNTRSDGDILLDLIAYKTHERTVENYRSYLVNEWTKRIGTSSVEAFLKNGFHEDAPRSQSISFNAGALVTKIKSLSREDYVPTTTLLLTPSLRTYDGRSKILPLMSEIPDPLTTITYGEWISVSEDLAGSLELRDGDVAAVSGKGCSLSLPIRIQPRLNKNMLMLERTGFGTNNLIFDTLSGEEIWYYEDIRITKTGEHRVLPIMSGSPSQEGRGIIPNPVKKEEHQTYTSKAGLYDDPNYPDYRWTMAIDMERCTGCSACVAACSIENNIPLVGAEEQGKGHEMSWIRIEPYYEKNNVVEFVPMLCQQCDYAPCEPVCPVYASYHNPEGLNAQVYNRCVGTRYCANNCPYKVRRFNWYDYTPKAPLDRMTNPEVSVRTKGIMEKCTFCVQRIRSAKDHAKDENRKVHDGEMIPACGESCPTNAITFGNLNDTTSKVYALTQRQEVHRIFDYLGVEPAVYYLHKK